MIKNVLYISYDGMTDPLGQSQVLPYLVGLSREGYSFTILSFEKKERYAANVGVIEKITRDAGIDWRPMTFTSYPPIISKFYDVIRMRRMVFSLHRQKKFHMVHCRSYIAADIGLRLKKRTGIKFFFDMRGFWADEKRDGGAWKDDHFIFSRVYKYYKRKEADYLRHADHIISLTHAGKNELISWPSYVATVPVSVIPCCADMDLFSQSDPVQKKNGRLILGLPEEGLILSYLGSLGAWYMLDEMLALFRVIRESYPDALFLFVTSSDRKMILNRLSTLGLPEESVKIIEASRMQVPVFIKASDINVSFIQPVYSKKSSSPTKLGEVLSMGIPVIVNSGVGDVESIVNENKCGIVVKNFDFETYKRITEAIPTLKEKTPSAIRHAIAEIFNLDKGIQLYNDAYKMVFSS